MEEAAAAHSAVGPTVVGTGAGVVAVSGVELVISRIENAARTDRSGRTGRTEAHWAASSLGGGSSSRARAWTCDMHMHMHMHMYMCMHMCMHMRMCMHKWVMVSSAEPAAK